MSKLKEMKQPSVTRGSQNFLYTIAGAGIVLIAIIATYLYLFPSQTAINPNTLEKGGHSEGNSSSKVRLVEFSDFQCPSCGYAYTQLQAFLPQYLKKIDFTYRHFPISSLHPYAEKAAEASECAADQNKFWEMHDKLFENQENLIVGDLKAYAQQLGLDSAKFNTCLDSGRYGPLVASSFSDGVSYGVDSTPTFFLNGQKMSYSDYAQFRQILDQKIAQSQ